MANTATREQRRQTRLKTREAARFRCAGFALPCEIRDYCSNGLYLSFSDPRALEALRPRLAGAGAQVEFVGEAGKGRRFQIDVEVAHVSTGGLGLHVERMPEGAIQALQVASQSTAPATSAMQSGIDPALGKATLQECNRLFRVFLNAVLQDFFSQAPMRLTQASYELSNFIERANAVDAIPLLAQHRARLEQAFFNAMRQHIQRIGQPEGEQESEQESEAVERGLSLVEEDEFQDWLNLSASINEVELATAIGLAEFERGYSQLIGMTLPRKRNPFAPELLFRGLQDAIQFLEFSNAVRAILYRMFSIALGKHIGDLYQQLNKVLAPLQPAAPPKRKKGEIKPPTPAPEPTERLEQRPAEPGPTDPADSADILDKLNKLGQSLAQVGAAAVPENAEYSLDRILASINSPARMSGGRAGYGADPYVGGRTVAGWMPVVPRRSPNLFEMAGRLRQTSRRLAEGRLLEGKSEVADAALPEANRRELLAALNALQPLRAQPRDGAPAALSDQVQAWFATAGGSPMRIAPSYRQTLDMASGLIGRARAEYGASSQVESLLQRLERPLLKLAIEDESFLVATDHPARQVVNLLDQYAIAADNQGRFFDPKLQRFLAQMVDRICAREGEEPGIYATVRDSLSRMLAPIRQVRLARVARLQESHEARERIRQARVRVGAALEARLGGREVPDPLLRLLDAGWRQYLILLEMRAGMQSQEWDAGLATLEQIIDGLGETRRTRPDARDSIPPLLSLIDRKLASVNVDSAQRAALLEELAAGFQRLADTPLPTTRYLSPVKPPVASGEGADAAEQDSLKAQLRVGEWWEFSLEDNWVPMQVIWIAQPPAYCVFANRSATDKLEFGLAELAGRMRGGLARPGKNLDLPLLDRSEFALFDDTYHGLLQQLQQDAVTGLDNRAGFLFKLGRVAAASAGQGLMVHTLCILEFDQFRLITNQHGAQAGALLARGLADELRKLIGPGDILSAVHEDTFALFLRNVAQSDAVGLAEGLLRQLGDYRFQQGNDSYRIGLNLGLAEYAPALVSTAEALRRADSACLAAKSLGRNRIQAFEPSNVQLRTQESLMGLAGRIDALMENGGLYLRAQMVMPISADSALLPYYEILLGITGDDGQPVPPMQFIPAIEVLKRSHEIDIWVAKQTFAWVRANQALFSSMGGFSINLSAQSLGNAEVLDYLLSELALADLPTEKLVFEITETAAIESYHVARDFMRQISGYGCKFSLDDFGSGYSSYSHLKNLQTHSLKIDGSFVKEMVQNPADFAMVKSMNDIGHSLGMKTVAEYVESAEILSKLREIGVDYAQGYIIHKPDRIEHLNSRQQG